MFKYFKLIVAVVIVWAVASLVVIGFILIPNNPTRPVLDLIIPGGLVSAGIIAVIRLLFWALDVLWEWID